MKLRNMVISIGVLAAAVLPAAAQGCADAETAMRTEAAVLGPMLTRLTQIAADFSSAEAELNEIYDYADQYGWDDDADFAAWDLEETLYDLEDEHAALLPDVDAHDAALKERVNAYQVACGANARATEVLAEYDIIMN